jgi:hypothetical protein
LFTRSQHGTERGILLLRLTFNNPLELEELPEKVDLTHRSTDYRVNFKNMKPQSGKSVYNPPFGWETLNRDRNPPGSGSQLSSSAVRPPPAPKRPPPVLKRLDPVRFATNHGTPRGCGYVPWGDVGRRDLDWYAKDTQWAQDVNDDGEEGAQLPSKKGKITMPDHIGSTLSSADILKLHKSLDDDVNTKDCASLLQFLGSHGYHRTAHSSQDDLVDIVRIIHDFCTFNKDFSGWTVLHTANDIIDDEYGLLTFSPLGCSSASAEPEDTSSRKSVAGPPVVFSSGSNDSQVIMQ